MCCSALQCGSLCYCTSIYAYFYTNIYIYIVLRCVAVCGSVWQCVAVFCSVSQCVAQPIQSLRSNLKTREGCFRGEYCNSEREKGQIYRQELVCCSALQRVALCCSMLQCGASLRKKDRCTDCSTHVPHKYACICVYTHIYTYIYMYINICICVYQQFWLVFANLQAAARIHPSATP